MMISGQCVIKAYQGDISACFSYFFSHTTVNHQPYRHPQNVFVVFQPSLSRKIYLHNYHVKTGGEIITRQTS